MTLLQDMARIPMALTHVILEAADGTWAASALLTVRESQVILTLNKHHR